MRQRSAGDMVVYLTECTLATVRRMAMKRSRGKYEYRRQISIAQKGVDFAVQEGLNVKGSRIESVSEIGSGSVAAWSKSFESQRRS